MFLNIAEQNESDVYRPESTHFSGYFWFFFIKFLVYVHSGIAHPLFWLIWASHVSLNAGLALLVIVIWFLPAERQARYYEIAETVESFGTALTMILIIVEFCFLTEWNKPWPQNLTSSHFWQFRNIMSKKLGGRFWFSFGSKGVIQRSPDDKNLLFS